MMAAKGARLRENEKEALLELAERIRVPQPLIRSVSDIVLEGYFDDTVLEAPRLDVHQFPQPPAQTSGNGGTLALEDEAKSEEGVSCSVKQRKRTTWRQKRIELKKFLKELVSNK